MIAARVNTALTLTVEVPEFKKLLEWPYVVILTTTFETL